MPLYRKKPITIEAVQWTGNNYEDVLEFGFPECVMGDHMQNSLAIDTLEGTMRADVGDWIIKGVRGEYYPCKPDIFEATYNPEV